MGGSKSIIMEIPESVAMEILSKLPVKSLVRFRCVCKHWSSSFQTSYFITKHLHNNLNNNNNNNNLNLLVNAHGGSYNLFHVSAEGNLVVTDNIQLPFCESIVEYGHCNGLLCLHEYEEDNIVLWNPSTREFKVIPESAISLAPSSYYCYGFCYLAFGYDSITNDYKIVRFVSSRQGEGNWIHQVELYSLKSDSWKEISPPKAQPCGSHPEIITYVNGFCYWEATDERLGKVVLSFDMATEKFSTLALPNFGSNNVSLQLLDFNNGQLGALATCYPRNGIKNDYYSDFWVMNDGSWTKQFKVECFGALRGFFKNGEIFFEGLINRELVLFDLATKEVKNLGVYGKCHIKPIAYVESLVPINGKAEDDEFIIIRSAS